MGLIIFPFKNASTSFWKRQYEEFGQIFKKKYYRLMVRVLF